MGREPRITVVGSNMVDLISYLGRFPDRGETVFGTGWHQGYGGKGANQAVMAAILGADVRPVMCVGDDVFGPEWMRHFESFGIDTSCVHQVPGNHSGVAAVWVEPSGDNRIVLGAGANENLSVEQVADDFASLPQPDLVLSQLEVAQEPILRGFQLAKDVGATTVLNPGPAAPIRSEVIAITDWLIPNETEFELLAREMYGIAVGDDMETAIRHFGDRTVTSLVVTLGEAGAMLYQPGEPEAKILAPPTVEAKDTTGAGDAFVGAFSWAIAAGRESIEAIELANVLASDSVTRPGTAVSYPRGQRLVDLLADLEFNRVG